MHLHRRGCIGEIKCEHAAKQLSGCFHFVISYIVITKMSILAVVRKGFKYFFHQCYKQRRSLMETDATLKNKTDIHYRC